jgi:dTDP-3-amino-3,4,6-trideoxy-alpha-D-glucose transaminase
LILMNDFRRQWQDTREDVLAAVAAVGERGWYILGAEVEAFERALAELWTLPYCAGVGCGLDAIEISLRALGCRPGDRVLTTPLSAFATTLAIVKTGAVPVFVDTDPFGLIDLDQCEALLHRRPDIRFMVPVHLYGHALDLARLEHLKDRFELAIVEDCAQSILATHQGRMTGTVGQMVATSFYPTKNLGALGDAGAILTRDESLWTAAKTLRDYGQTAKYRHDMIGYNSRLDELHAAILRRAFLPRLAGWTARRREIARRYLAGLACGSVRAPGVPPGSDSCFHLFPVITEPARKASFCARLQGRGIIIGEHYPIAIPEQPAMAGVAHEVAGAIPLARCFVAAEASLPVHPYMTDQEADSVIAACNTPQEERHFFGP